MLLDLSYFLNVKKFPRGHFIYREGDKSDEIAIIKHGSFELKKRILNNDVKQILHGMQITNNHTSEEPIKELMNNRP